MIVSQTIEANLLTVVDELKPQLDVGSKFPSHLQSFPEQIEQLYEWIVDVGEYSLAYESLVSILEQFPFQLSGLTTIRFLEVALLMKYKTARKIDQQFDSRQGSLS